MKNILFLVLFFVINVVTAQSIYVWNSRDVLHKQEPQLTNTIIPNIDSLHITVGSYSLNAEFVFFYCSYTNKWLCSSVTSLYTLKSKTDPFAMILLDTTNKALQVFDPSSLSFVQSGDSIFWAYSYLLDIIQLDDQYIPVVLVKALISRDDKYYFVENEYAIYP